MLMMMTTNAAEVFDAARLQADNQTSAAPVEVSVGWLWTDLLTTVCF